MSRILALDNVILVKLVALEVISCTFKSHAAAVKYLSCVHEIVKLILNFTIDNENSIDI